MATDRDTLKFQRSGDSLIKDLYADFGCKTTSVPLFVPMDTKQPSTRNWADEDGEDVFFPTELMLAAYDTEVSIIYTGDTGTFQPKQEALFDYLKGGELSVYSPYSNTGCKGAYLKGFSDFDFVSDSSGDMAQFKINFRVTKPGETFSV